MTENVIDIDTKKPIKPDIPEDATVSQWMKIWTKYIKDNKAKTVVIMGVDCDGQAFCDIIGVRELDLLKLWRETEFLKDMIDGMLEPEIDVELEYDEETDE